MEQCNDDKGRLPAALVPLYGAGKKPWSLEGEVLAIGRARGCDVCLESPDISSLHCVIWRNSAGWHIRDCGSRAGTLINGDRIREATLRDDDVLQIGPFSFRIQAPGPKSLPVVSVRSERLKRIEKSRRNLARLALAMRRQLRDGPPAASDSAPPGLELNRQASGLRQRIREIELRAQRLEQAERDLARDRENLDRERRAFRALVEQTERELARRRSELEGAATPKTPDSCPLGSNT
jgi:hypothetical protein